jgi:hypothetical protein
MPRKPPGLQIASFLCMALGAGLAIALVLTPLDRPWYNVNDHVMRGREFARAFAVPSALMAVTLFIAGWSLFRDHARSRTAMLVAIGTFWGAGAWFEAYFLGSGVLIGALWRGILLLATCAAFLYGWPSLRRYYGSLN